VAIRKFAKLLTQDLNVGTDAATKPNPGGGTLTGFKIGIHSFAIGLAAVSATWDPGEIPVGGKVSTTVPVPGAALGDFVIRSFSLDLQELVLTADVSAADTVEAVLANNTGAPVDLASGTLRVLVLKSR
jgi:hypothetical protein